MQQYFSLTLLFMLMVNNMSITGMELQTMNNHSCADKSIEQKLLDGTVKFHEKRKININRETLIPLHKNIKYIAGEIAMYNASRFLGINMVPPVVIKKEMHNDEEVISCRSYWIEPSDITIKNSDQLKHLVSPKEWAYMNIFYFLFGQYDRHFSNQIISKDTGKLYLIDNEALARVKQCVYEYSQNRAKSIPWVELRVNDNIPSINEPSDLSAIINTKQDPAYIHAYFPDVDQWTKVDIDNGFCKIWHKGLWRQLYGISDYLSPAFSDTISVDLLDTIKSLTPPLLTSFWPQLPFSVPEESLEEYNNLISEFIRKTLARREMIVRYFEQHPENVVSFA